MESTISNHFTKYQELQKQIGDKAAAKIQGWWKQNKPDRIYKTQTLQPFSIQILTPISQFVRPWIQFARMPAANWRTALTSGLGSVVVIFSVVVLPFSLGVASVAATTTGSSYFLQRSRFQLNYDTNIIIN